MKSWNGQPLLLRTLDPADALGRNGWSCLTCGAPLPKGRARVYCLEHSEYPQSLMREVRFKRARLPGPREVSHTPPDALAS